MKPPNDGRMLLVMDELISIENKDETPLRMLSKWVIYRLCREGKLQHVKIGRRRYLTADGIAAFMARGGEAVDPQLTGR